MCAPVPAALGALRLRRFHGCGGAPALKLGGPVDLTSKQVPSFFLLFYLVGLFFTSTTPEGGARDKKRGRLGDALRQRQESKLSVWVTNRGHPGGICHHRCKNERVCVWAAIC